MGFVTLTATCIVCSRVFTCNPVRVPSTSVLTGKREPLCRACFEKINERREEQGSKPFPLADDAYDACEESELG